MSNKIRVINDDDLTLGKKQKFYRIHNVLNEKLTSKKTYTFSYTKDKTIILASVFNKDQLNDDEYHQTFGVVYFEVDPQLVTSVNNKYFIPLRSTDNKSEDYFEVIEHNGKYFIKLDFTNNDDDDIDNFNNSILKLLLFKCNADIEFMAYYDDNSKTYFLAVLLIKFYV